MLGASAASGSAVRVGFMTPFDVHDPLAWSGVVAPMFAALARQVDLVHLAVPDRRPHVVDRALARFLGRRYLPNLGLASSHSLGSAVSSVVRAAEVDVVLGVAASTALSRADVGVPLVEVSDATFRVLAGYYPMFSDLHWTARWQGEAMARRGASHSSAFLLASQWAADSLRDDYGVAPSRIRVAPFGPSVTASTPPSGPRADGPLRVLFVGSDWRRKGGEQAVATVEELHRRDVPSELTVVGDAPDLPAIARREGRVGRDRMASLYAEHDVLLEPASANAGGVTLTDATASGLPVVATRTGGVPSIVDDGVTGILVAPDNAVPEAADALVRLTSPALWQSMSSAALLRGREELSWQRWAVVASSLCAEVVAPRP